MNSNRDFNQRAADLGIPFPDREVGLPLNLDAELADLFASGLSGPTQRPRSILHQALSLAAIERFFTEDLGGRPAHSPIGPDSNVVSIFRENR
jgi:hypothetical protein